MCFLKLPGCSPEPITGVKMSFSSSIGSLNRVLLILAEVSQCSGEDPQDLCQDVPRVVNVSGSFVERSVK